MKVDIPGYKILNLEYLLLDYNGTIAVDREIPAAVKEKLLSLSKTFKIYVLTADTHGTAAQRCADLPVEIKTFPNGTAMQSKLAIAKSLGLEKCAAVGNGRNDCLMCKECVLSIAIAGREGASGRLISQADVCVTSIVDGLELLEKPKRLIATLRG